MWVWVCVDLGVLVNQRVGVCRKLEVRMRVGTSLRA